MHTTHCAPERVDLPTEAVGAGADGAELAQLHISILHRRGKGRKGRGIGRRHRSHAEVPLPHCHRPLPQLPHTQARAGATATTASLPAPPYSQPRRGRTASLCVYTAFVTCLCLPNGRSRACPTELSDSESTSSSLPPSLSSSLPPTHSSHNHNSYY